MFNQNERVQMKMENIKTEHEFNLNKRSNYLRRQFFLGKKAVFFIHGDFKVIDADGEKFDRLLRDAPKQLVGVYNSICTKEMIDEDMIYMMQL